MSLKLGCIADDFTGATDLANNLVRAGMRAVQTIGVPKGPLDEAVDAVVVALKSRTSPAEEAVQQSLQALAWLRRQGAQQIYFKYCSTFDSLYEGERRGNIGPVTEALMAALGTDFTIATPAFPDNGRSVFKGHLFVGDTLLSESGMQHHPLTPMRDANLVRVMQAQCQGKVGLIDHRCVAAGSAAIIERIRALRQEGVSVAIVDALDNADLLRLGPALSGMPLVTAGSGVAIGLPGNFGLAPSAGVAALPSPTGAQAIISGSCSLATNRQVQDFIAGGGAALALDPLQVARDQAEGRDPVQAALAWARPRLGDGPVLVYSTAESSRVKAIQTELGVDAAGALMEHCLSGVAAGLVANGVRQLIVAGGETSGACVQALGIAQLRIGAQIDPGVPWCHARSPLSGEVGLHLALKSGNFGSDDFFRKAFGLLA